MPENPNTGDMSLMRRRRIDRLKKYILIFIMIMILIPLILCMILLIKVNKLEREIKTLSRNIQSTEEVMSLPEEMTTVSIPDEEEQSEMEFGDNSSVNNNIYLNEYKYQDVERKEYEETSRKVYLTFDDGPSIYTDEILDILDEYGVKATFFVLARENEKYEPMYLRIIDEGHTLGMHSYTHEYTDIYKDLISFESDVMSIQRFIYDLTGYESTIYRFPGGSSNSYCKKTIQSYISFLQEEGIQYFDWNISSQDASTTSLTSEEITQNVLSMVENYDNCIILMHDAASKHSTVEALPTIIEGILAMEDTQILPITSDTIPVQHRKSE